MFKKILVLTLCALMLLTSAMAEGWTAPAAGSEFTSDGDLGLYIDGHWYPIMFPFDYVEEYSNETGLHEALGEELDMPSAPSCAYNGDDKEFDYDGLSIYTNPLGDFDIWMEAYIEDGDWTTSRGIGIGATADDIFAAYGEGFVDSDTITYNLANDPYDFESPCIIFTLEDDVVANIDIYYPTNTL